MRILLLLLAIAGTLCAQSPASNGSVPGWQSIVNSMLSQNSGAAPTGGTPAAIKPPRALAAQMRAIAPGSTLSAQAGANAVTPCSVPLLNAQIPTDVNFTMRTIEPPTDKVDRMQVVVPAPACPESPR
jgi:hypothetical protein